MLNAMFHFLASVWNTLVHHHDMLHSYVMGIWHNWGVSVFDKPEQIVYPKSVEEIKKVVALATTEKKTLRCVGAGHSFSPLCQTDGGIMVNMGKMTKIIKLDLVKKQITIQPGVTVGQLDDMLNKHDLCIPSNVVLKTVTWGGLISTGSHGTGVNCCPTSDLVAQIKFIDGNGNDVTLSESDEEFYHAKASLGLFGVLYEITLKVMDNFVVESSDTLIPFCDTGKITMTAKQLEEYVTKNDYIELQWIPFNDTILLKRTNRSSKPVDFSPFDLKKQSVVDFIRIQFGIRLFKFMMIFPAFTPAMSKMISYLMPKRAFVGRIADAVHYSDSIPYFKVINPEFQFAVAKTSAPVFGCYQSGTTQMPRTQKKVESKSQWQLVIDCFQSALDVVYGKAEQGKYPVNLLIHTRFTRGGNSFLSLGKQDDIVCWMEALSYAGTVGASDCFSKDIFPTWLEMTDGVPHWPKQWQSIPGIVDRIKRRYAEDRERFNGFRVKRDPNGIFSNPLLKSIFDDPTKQS